MLWAGCHWALADLPVSLALSRLSQSQVGFLWVYSGQVDAVCNLWFIFLSFAKTLFHLQMLLLARSSPPLGSVSQTCWAPLCVAQVSQAFQGVWSFHWHASLQPAFQSVDPLFYRV